MPDLLDPGGMLGRGFMKGYVTPAADATSMTVTIPWPGVSSYIPFCMPMWNTTIDLTAHGDKTFTFQFGTPAPGSVKVWWVILF